MFKKILYILSFKWLDDIIEEDVDAGILDLSGQGRNKYGR